MRCLSCCKQIESQICPHCGYPASNPNDEHQLPVGTVLRERYQIGKVLGQGGFGITYLAWDDLMGRCVAVKEFYPNGAVFRRSANSTHVECVTKGVIPHYEYSKERFLREARALVQFQDIPEIVNIHDFVKENNTAYIVMEFVKGVDLAKYIKRKGGTLSVGETFRILRPVMEALAKVHKGGIVHRDISPDNIILDPMGGAKLLDFGAVRAVENPDVEQGLNKSTEAILKQGFAPMEQYNSRGSLGPWTDEYAMCATVWYCLTGRIPEDAALRMTEGIDPDWSAVPGLPVYQQKALARGFSCRPRDRYPDMDSFLRELFPEEAEKPAREEKTQSVSQPQVPPREEKQPVNVSRAESAAPPKQEKASLPEEEKKEPPAAAVKEGPPAEKKQKNPTGSRKKFLVPAVIAVVAIIAALALFSKPDKPNEEIVNSVGNSYTAAPKSDDTIGMSADDSQTIAPKSDDTIDISADDPQIIDPKSVDTNVISAGDSHIAGLNVDGTVVAMGNNFRGKCDVGSWRDIVAVSAGGDHTVGLKADGTVVAVGLNEYGRCDVDSWRDIVAVSAGGDHTVGLKADGTVVAVGVDSSGRCDVASWRDIVAISAGDYHTVGLKADGTVVAVGGNEVGQCDVASWRDIVAVSVGGDHTVGLKADGTVVAVGNNFNGQCDVDSWHDIVAVSAGAYHTVGLKADGTVVTAGWNSYGQCDVNFWRDIVAVSAGERYTVGLKADGTVMAVGFIAYGEYDLSSWKNIRIPEKKE